MKTKVNGINNRETTSPQENQELSGVKSRTFPGQVYYRIKTGVAKVGVTLYPPPPPRIEGEYLPYTAERSEAAFILRL